MEENRNERCESLYDSLVNLLQLCFYRCGIFLTFYSFCSESEFRSRWVVLYGQEKLLQIIELLLLFFFLNSREQIVELR